MVSTPARSFPRRSILLRRLNPEIGEQTGAAIAAEARATGVDMILAPVLDLAREPRWGRVEEDFGEDPYFTGQMGLAYVRGAQGESFEHGPHCGGRAEALCRAWLARRRHEYVAGTHRRARVAQRDAEVV